MQRLLLLSCACAGLLLTVGSLAAQTTAKDAAKAAEILKADKSADKRLLAAQDLAAVGKVKNAYLRPYTGLLLQAFKQDSDTMVRAAAGSALLVFEADPKEVVPAVTEVVKNEKEPGAVLAVAARLAAFYQIKELIPDLEAYKKREEAKDDPKLRDQRLLQAVNLALKSLAK